MIYTYQELEAASDKTKFVHSAIQAYINSDAYKTARLADEYDRQMNPTITNAVRTIYNISGLEIEDTTASNIRIACNLFNRLNTQRCMYSLGNGVSFVDPYEAARGKPDNTKERLGKHFDHKIRESAYHALIHGRSYLFYNGVETYEFTATEFVPLEDEIDGRLRAGIRFWRIHESKPLNAVLYEADGYTTYSTEGGTFHVTKEKAAYSVTYTYTDMGDTISIDEESISSTLPIVRMYASRLKQSTLIGLREAIDAYDLIQSGFANDLRDCAQIYWIVENFGGMTDEDLAQFLDRLKLNHIANADTQAGGKVTPYTQEVPYASRQAFLADMRARMYEDFGVLDVHTVAAGSTDDHIEMGYQTMDDNAADFEHWVGDAIVQLLELQGIDDTPVFRRNKVVNKGEQVDMVVKEAAWLDETTIIRKLPNLTPDEVQAVLLNKQQEDLSRFGMSGGGKKDEAGEEGEATNEGEQ